MRHGSEKRPTMHLASMVIKTAFDVARPKHIVKIMGDQDVHGWIRAAFLREMASLERLATFEAVENTFPFTRCIRQGSVEAPRLWLEMAMHILSNAEPEWMKKEMGFHTGTCEGRDHEMCSFMWAGGLKHYSRHPLSRHTMFQSPMMQLATAFCLKLLVPLPTR